MAQARKADGIMNETRADTAAPMWRPGDEPPHHPIVVIAQVLAGPSAIRDASNHMTAYAIVRELRACGYVLVKDAAYD
jgi:hypothetical protein